MSEGMERHGDVDGERGAPAVNRGRSLQSRINNFLAAGLMLALGLGMLGWYYSNAFAQAARSREISKRTNQVRAQSELALPAIGPIQPPALLTPLVSDPVPPEPLAAAPDAAMVASDPLDRPALDAAAAPARTAAQASLERRLSGAVFGRSPTETPSAAHAPSAPAGDVADPSAGPARVSAVPAAPAIVGAIPATLLPPGRLLLPKGTFVDCTLETAIDSTLPGMTTCVTATDTFGADGAVVLMERGTRLIGETRGQIQQGATRIQVIWNEARTPTGVLVPLGSPGVDELGRAGLPGRVNRHFWERFGAAILVSTIDGAVQAAAASAGGGGGTVIFNPAGSRDVATEILKDTLAIPPTVVKSAGDRVQAFVARDIDFSRVYRLQASANAR